MNRRDQLLDEPEGEGWITTFADLMTLLLVFFVLLFSMSTVEAERFEQMLSSLQTSFGDGGSSNAIIEMPHSAQKLTPTTDAELSTEPLPPNAPITPQNEESATPSISKDWMGLADELRKTLSNFEVDKAVDIDIPTEGILSIQIRGQALFDSGSSHLNYQVDQVLDSLMQVFHARHDFTINIQGHTDNIPINTVRYESNWELSALRATTVLRYLIEKGITPGRLTATGYGDSLPLESNDTEAGRARNRRIEFVLEKKQTGDLRRLP